MYCERTATHMILFFLDKNRQTSDKMSVMKLIKLLYLSERECIGKHGETICDDTMFSLPRGPVLSHTYDLLAGKTNPTQKDWLEWIDHTDSRDIKLKKNQTIDEDTVERLSRLDHRIMQDIWNRFGSMTAEQLSGYTHNPEKIPEWQDPHGSSIPIEYEDIFKAYGYDDEEAKDCSDEIRSFQALDDYIHQHGEVA